MKRGYGDVPVQVVQLEEAWCVEVVSEVYCSVQGCKIDSYSHTCDAPKTSNRRI